MAAAPPACASAVAAGVQPGEFIGAQYNVGGRPIINELIVVLLSPGQQGAASIVTPDEDDYKELYVGTADLLRWDVLPGGATGGVMPWAVGARCYQSCHLPMPAALLAAATAADARAERGVAGLIAALGGPAAAPGAPAPLAAPPLAAAAAAGALLPAPAAPAPAPAAAAPPAAADARIQPMAYNALSARLLSFGKLLARFRDHQRSDWHILGPRTTLRARLFVLDDRLTPLGRRSKWRSEGRLAAMDARVTDHERCCFYLEQRARFDQPNAPGVASDEMARRGIQAARQRSRRSDFFLPGANDGADVLSIASAVTRAGPTWYHPNIGQQSSSKFLEDWHLGRGAMPGEPGSAEKDFD
ncbi:unnamed protein product [Prorocentrum cordatum]|uniref:Phospholipase B-like n=1 Tax=Prorocentrum cordatum TaxID=2364126 RepID=A0ABN9TP71_9DINO|nr:unnamed protein product [Polarella glacialis]